MTYKLPEPEFQLKWHSSPAAYRVSKPNIGDTDVYTAEQMQAAYAAGLAAREGWQPIETAPKDETAIITMYMHIDTQIVNSALWIDDENCPGWWSYTMSEVSCTLLDDWRTPTHWMPLPAAPEPTK